MDKLGYIVSGLVVGALLGVRVAFALTPVTPAPKAAIEGTAWTKYHAAIPAQAATEEAPTF